MPDDNNEITIEEYEIGKDKNLEDFLSQDSTVELGVKYGLFAGNWRSKVLSFDNNVMVLSLPKKDVKSDDFIDIWPNVKAEVVFMKHGDGMYTFKTEIIQPNPVLGNLEIKVPEKISRLQRRRYKRVQTPGLTTYYRIYSEEGEEEEFREGEVLDISAGGMKLRLEGEKIEVGTLLELSFLFEGDSFDGIIGEVVWNAEIGDAEPKKYLHGINFIQITPNQRQKLMKHVLRLDREEYLKQKQMEKGEE